MKYAVVFGLVATSLCGLARASSGFEAEMKEVIAKEERASTFEEVVAVAEAFAQIGKDHPGQVARPVLGRLRLQSMLGVWANHRKWLLPRSGPGLF